MTRKETRAKIKRILRDKGADKKDAKELARAIVEALAIGRGGEVYTLDELQLMYKDFVETEIEDSEIWRYDDCVDMFVKFMKTGSTHPTLEELSAERE